MDNMKTGVAGGSFLIKQTDLEDTFFPEDLTEEHKMIQRTAQQFITKEVHPRHKEIEEQQNFAVVVELLKKAEIGRASCRERVEISVVEASYRKRKGDVRRRGVDA